MDELLGWTVWEEDAVGDEVRAYLMEHLGDLDAVLVIDGFGGATRCADAAWACADAGVAAHLGWARRQGPALG